LIITDRLTRKQKTSRLFGSGYSWLDFLRGNLPKKEKAYNNYFFAKVIGQLLGVKVEQAASLLKKTLMKRESAGWQPAVRPQ